MRDQIISAMLFDVAQGQKIGFAGFEAFYKEEQTSMLEALGTLSRQLIRGAAVQDDDHAMPVLRHALQIFVTTQLRDALYSGDTSHLPSMTDKVLNELLATRSESQIAYICSDIARDLGPVQVALVQSPTLLSTKQKQTMIQDLARNQTPFFPLFLVRRELLGGVRVLLGDTLFDDTFHTQLRRLFATVS